MVTEDCRERRTLTDDVVCYTIPGPSLYQLGTEDLLKCP